jgi:ergothioneine biosynthesis glutamate--cysteine ligase EgtA
MATGAGLSAGADQATTLDRDGAWEYIAAGALRPGVAGQVGLELERHLVDLIEPARRPAWRRIAGALAGVKPPAGSALSLEPGGQLELSTRPACDVETAIRALRGDCAVTDGALAAAGLTAVSIGADPARPPHRIHPGDRYAAMADYFTAAGHAGDGAVMMTATASLQVNVDAGPSAGWADRVAHLYRLCPALMALSACSPLLAGRDAAARSARQLTWQRLDPPRTAPYPGHGDPAGAWATFALAAPVMFVRDGTDGRCRAVRQRVPLLEWVSGTVRLAGRLPTAADVDLHLTTLWPPVRLRGWLELRVLDAVPAAWWPALAAIVATVIDDPVAADRAAEAAEPVAMSWRDAATAGIRLPALRRAVTGIVEAAASVAPASVRDQVERWADLADQGRGPADLVTARAAASGPEGCLADPGLR